MDDVYGKKAFNMNFHGICGIVFSKTVKIYSIKWGEFFSVNFILAMQMTVHLHLRRWMEVQWIYKIPHGLHQGVIAVKYRMHKRTLQAIPRAIVLAPTTMQIPHQVQIRRNNFFFINSLTFKTLANFLLSTIGFRQL